MIVPTGSDAVWRRGTSPRSVIILSRSDSAARNNLSAADHDDEVQQVVIQSMQRDMALTKHFFGQRRERCTTNSNVDG